MLIVAGEPKSIFFEILIKALKYKNYKSPIIIISSKKLLYKEIHKTKLKKKIRLINIKDLKKLKLDNKCINLIDTAYSSNKKNYIKNSFKIAFKIIKSGFAKKMINGPINKKEFLEKKFLGVTEFIAKEFKQKKLPFIVCRPLPNSKEYEYWKLNDLMY